MNASSSLGSPVLSQQLLQRAGAMILPSSIAISQSKRSRFVHVGGGDDDTHLRAARADRVDEIPELAARERIDAGRRLVENEQIRIVDQRAAEAELLLHAAGELAGGPIVERIEARGGQKLVDPGAALRRRLTEQSAEEVDVLEHAERRIEIAAEALRHVGDAAANLLADALCSATFSSKTMTLPL